MEKDCDERDGTPSADRAYSSQPRNFQALLRGSSHQASQWEYDLKVWIRELVHLVKQKLVERSNFPEEKVLELLECYDVSLQRGWTFPWHRTEEKYDDPKFGN